MKKCIAANWKMYKTPEQAARTAHDLAHELDGAAPENREVVVFPPFTDIAVVREPLLAAGVAIGGQNMHPAAEGAFTGEISAPMLRGAGCEYVLIGHSERRHIFHEQDAFLAQKVEAALKASLHVVFCVGETLEEREQGRLGQVLERQVREGLGPAQNAAFAGETKLTLAYEPVWAIGTGKNAGPREIEDAHGTLRELLTACFGHAGDAFRILYGGSVKPENAAQILHVPHVDGVLVGGASLDARSFARIIYA